MHTPARWHCWVCRVRVCIVSTRRLYAIADNSMFGNHCGHVYLYHADFGRTEMRARWGGGVYTCYVGTPYTGVWGPVYGTVLPDKWLIEAGQSAVGRVLDEVRLCLLHILLHI
jgi:hypothetical protein